MGIARSSDLDECVLILERTLPERFTQVGKMEYMGYYPDVERYEFGFIFMDYVLHFRYLRAVPRSEALFDEPFLGLLNPNIETFHKWEDFEIRIAPHLILNGEFKTRLSEFGMPLND